MEGLISIRFHLVFLQRLLAEDFPIGLVMMEPQHFVGGCPVLQQTDVETWLPSNARGFLGGGLRFKAKLIGVETVPNASGEKMCKDAMIRLKRMAKAARKRGKHKQSVWLKVSSRGLQILDEQTGALQHEHERSRISSFVNDKQDVTALAYIYQQADTYSLIYVKMAHLAKPVLDTIKEMFEKVDQDFPQCSAETLARGSETMKRSIHLSEPFLPTSPLPEPQQQILSNSQLLPIFPTQPIEGARYTTPPYSPSNMSCGQQPGLLGDRGTSPLETLWSSAPVNVSSWESAGITAPAAVNKICVQDSQLNVDTSSPPSLHLFQMNISSSDFCNAGNAHESLC
ncbi:disabled homolog 1-like isoform X1 [Phyllopteryx taeniolatus]|uniref:disabled homolog 1-like isoform X1 n=1 Tax=Phyllopteryx taeniolatus TaxID=161469 RepID=UPI002AD23864|nr:disabled homolog 1-like isoform X1 [Phyllopteryx taeniolatus]